MVNLFNPDLFVVETKKTEDEHGSRYTSIFKSSVLSTVKSSAKIRDTKKVARTVATVVHEAEDTLNKENTKVKVETAANGKSIVCIEQSKKNRYDTEMFLIGIPYNGIIEPIEESYDFRIYRGLIVHMDWKDALEIDGLRYNKIVYLACVPNLSLLDPKSRHYKEEVCLPINTYNMSMDPKSGEKNTVKTERVIRWLSKDPKEVVMETRIVEADPVDMEDFKGRHVIPIFTGEVNKSHEKEKQDLSEVSKPEKARSDMKKYSERKTSEKKEGTAEKSSFRYKSESVGNFVTQKSLDEMLQDMKKQDKEKRSDEYRKKNKRNRKRRR